MLTDTNDRPGLDEQYIAATNASDLTLNPDRRCAADHLIAAGLAANRMGDALGHLRSEWDAAAKPPKWTEEDVSFRAELLFSVLGMGRNGKADLKRARTEVMFEYSLRMRRTYERLQGRALAMAILEEWAALRGVDPSVLSQTLYHWLNPTCPVCDGLGKRRLPDAPVLGKTCHHCEGRTTWPLPLDRHGSSKPADRVKSFLKGCTARARGDRGDLLRGDVEVTPMADRLRGPVQQDDSPEAAAQAAAFFAASMGGRKR